MSSLSDAKVLGGVGSILVLLTTVPNVGWLLGIAGFIMILAAFRNISQLVNDKKIYNNMLTAVILAIGAIVAGTITVASAAFSVLKIGTFVGTKFVLASNLTAIDWTGVVVTAIVGVLAVEALLVASAVFVRRSYKSVASKLNLNMFETAGLLYLIGAATVLVGVGFLLIFVAEILLAVSFFSIKDEQRVPESQLQTVAVTS